MTCAFERTRDRCSAEAVVVCSTCRAALCSSHARANEVSCPRCGVDWFASLDRIATVHGIFAAVLDDAELSTKPVRDLLSSARESLGEQLVYATSRRARAVAKRIALEAAFARGGSRPEHLVGVFGSGTV
ncbi:MAG: hypothetical protein M3P18_13720 [Actinomycetota bacterium]|nr:hypothetical protein [Actinomycetota bacterium]